MYIKKNQVNGEIFRLYHEKALHNSFMPLILTTQNL